MELIGQDTLEDHLKRLVEKGLIPTRRAEHARKRLRNRYTKFKEQLHSSRRSRLKYSLSLDLLVHLYSSRYIQRAIDRKIEETNVVINTFVELWNAGEIGNEESRIAIEKTIKRKKSLEEVYTAAQKRNQLEFESHIESIQSFSKEIEEIEKNDNQEKLKERIEAIRASIGNSLRVLSRTNTEFETCINQLLEAHTLAREKMTIAATDPERYQRIAKRIEALIDIAKEYQQNAKNFLSKQSQFEFERVLAKDVIIEEYEHEMLNLLIDQLEDAGKIPALFDQEEVIAELLPSSQEKRKDPQQQSSTDSHTALKSTPMKSSPLSADPVIDEEESSLSDKQASLKHHTKQFKTLEDADDELVDPWSFVGSILLSETGKPLGVCGEPIVASNGEIFLGCFKEDNIDLEKSDQIFREMSMILKGASDSSIARKQLLEQEIAQTLRIPPELALKPTFIREYFGKKNIVSLKLPIELELSLKAIDYYSFNSLALNNDQRVARIVSGSYRKDTEGTLVPSSWTTDIPDPRMQIKRFDGSDLGIVRGVLSTTYFGALLVAEFDKPSHDLANEVQQDVQTAISSHSKRPGIWSLRFLVARRLDGVFEGEALLYWNVWRYIWEEKVPILPWDLRMDYVRLVPAGAIAAVEKSEVHLKRRMEPHPLSIIVPLSDNATVISNGVNVGRFVGFDLDDEGIPGILVSQRSTKEILSSIGRATSDEYIRRLGARISKALGLPVEQAMTPRAIACYLLFFVRLVDVPTFSEAMDWLREHLGLQFFRLMQIEKVTNTVIYVTSEDGLINQ